MRRPTRPENLRAKLVTVSLTDRPEPSKERSASPRTPRDRQRAWRILGFFTAYPVNRWLVRTGGKEKMDERTHLAEMIESLRERNADADAPTRRERDARLRKREAIGR